MWTGKDRGGFNPAQKYRQLRNILRNIDLLTIMKWSNMKAHIKVTEQAILIYVRAHMHHASTQAMNWKKEEYVKELGGWKAKKDLK